MDFVHRVEGMGITRRSFIRLGLLAGAAMTLPSCGPRPLTLPFVDEIEPASPRGPESWTSSVCTLCPAGCGLSVRVIDGKAVGLKGIADHPVNRGKLCPRGLAGLQNMYHPDRLRGPARRVGKRQDNRWEPVSWDEAVQIITGRLEELKQRAETYRFGMLLGAETPLVRALFERFGQAYGTPNTISLDWPMGQGPVDAFTRMQGSADWNYDLSGAAYIISFGMDWLQAFPSPVEASLAYGHLRRGLPDQRVRIVQVEPRRSVTGIKADVWVPVKPGTEGALALGMACTLITEGLYDRDFVEKNTAGFEDWTDSGGNQRAGFKSVVLSEYTPEAVTAITGIPADMTARLAREFASRKPALALTDRLDLGTQMAVHSLNILTGAIGVAGGVRRRNRPPLPFAPLSSTTAYPRLDGAGVAFPHAAHTPHHLPDLTPESMPYTLDTLLLHRANPLFLSQNAEGWGAFMERIPFIVSISSILDETALFADIILPESASLEDWQETGTSTLDGVPVFGVGKPAIRPLYDTRHAGDMALRMAQSAGLNEALPWENFEGVIREEAGRIYEQGDGSLIGPVAEDEQPESSDDFWAIMIRNGGWADRAVKGSTLKLDTPSGKIEWIPGSGTRSPDLSALLKQEATEPEQDGLFLCVYTPLAFSGGEGAHLPALQMIAGPYLRERWETWIEINPETAKRLGIRDRDPVWVESSRGRIRATARWFQGTRPDVASMPFGLGHDAQGRWAQGIGTSPGDLVSPALDAMTGQPLWQATRVKVYRVEGGSV